MTTKPTLSSMMTETIAKSAIAIANNPLMKAADKAKSNFSKAALKNMALSTVMATSLMNGMMPSAQAAFFSEDQIDRAGGIKKMMMQGANFVSDHPFLSAGMAAGTMGLLYAFAPYMAASMFGDPSEFATSTAGKLFAGDAGSAMDKAMAADGMMSTLSNVLWNTAKFGIPTLGGIWGLNKVFGRKTTFSEDLRNKMQQQQAVLAQTSNRLNELYRSNPLNVISEDDSNESGMNRFGTQNPYGFKDNLSIRSNNRTLQGKDAFDAIIQNNLDPQKDWFSSDAAYQDYHKEEPEE